MQQIVYIHEVLRQMGVDDRLREAEHSRLVRLARRLVKRHVEEPPVVSDVWLQALPDGQYSASMCGECGVEHS